MHTPDTLGGKTVLTLAHVAGMTDMVALPLWIGALMQHYHYSPAQAGLTVTLFLLGVVVASAVLALRFNRLPQRAAAASGFARAAACFALATGQPQTLASGLPLAVLHAVAGLGVGCALTCTHGSIGRSANPHRLFASVNVVLGVFALLFLGGVPQLILQLGAPVLFAVIAVTMALAAAVCAGAFPQTRAADVPAHAAASTLPQLPQLPKLPQLPTLPQLPQLAQLPKATWFVIATVMCLTLNQAMVLRFVERIGAEHGSGMDRVNGVLIALGLVTLTPGVLAALLQKKWSPVAVGIGGRLGQAGLALLMTGSLAFGGYAVAAAFYVFMVIFTHTFLSGLLSRLDPSGRAAATPAMMRVGSCIGPARRGAARRGAGRGWAMV